MTDAASVVYLIILLSMGINTCLLLWWGYVYPKASVIFICVTILFVSLEFTYLLSYLNRINGVLWYEAIRDKWWWTGKNVPVAIVNLALNGVFISRLIKDK